MIYRARKDLWVTYFIAVTAILMSGAGMVMSVLAVIEREYALLIPASMLLVVAGMLLWAFTSTTYELSSGELNIKSGPLRWRLSLDDVEEVRLVESLGTPGWSLGWSLNKVGIKPRGRALWYWIAPEEKVAFLAELRRYRPDLKLPAG